jgi:hypothetical protein
MESTKEPFDYVEFDVWELVNNIVKHRESRPLVVLLKKAPTKWYNYRCCGKPVLSVGYPGPCFECFSVQ